MVDRALNELNINDDFDIISNIADILSLGVMSTPALMINGKVIFSGRVPTVEEVKEAITKNK
ncbi:thioredoxin family protein [Alkaliphilus hydrothermalis]|uniref:thioredoxin family protein n=1 Tax=Alkaliphilus hydrothermalis TaxID=1482730 RepID=UPI0019590960